MFQNRKSIKKLAAIVLAVAGVAAPLSADFLDVRMFNSANYTQTAGGPVFQGYNFEMDAITQSAAAFNSAEVTYPGAGSPVALTQSPTDPTFFNTNFGPYSTLAALHASLPFGNYTTTFTNGSITDSATIDYNADHFQGSIPELTAASFAGVEDWNPSHALTLSFNGFTPDPATTGSVGTYIDIFGPDGSNPFSTFVAPGVTSIVIPAGTLQGNTSYSLAIEQGGRIETSPNAEGVETEFGFSINDNINFTTAPETSDFVLGMLALAAGLGAHARRRVAPKSDVRGLAQ